MESLIESVLIYGLVGILCILVVFLYLRKQKRGSRAVEDKIEKAKLEGAHEPVSLHPVVDHNSCIGSGACIAACPEKDILGIRNGKATTINALSDPSGLFLATDAGTGIYISKSANSAAVVIKNRMGAAKTIGVLAVRSSLTATAWS